MVMGSRPYQVEGIRYYMMFVMSEGSEKSRGLR